MNSSIVKKIGICFFSALTIFGVCAAENDNPGFRSEGGRRQMNGNRERGNRRQAGGNRMMRGGMMGGLANFIAEEEIRAKFPKEFAELEKSALELDKKQAELAAKAGVKLQETMESKLRKLRAADPAGFTAVIAEIKKNPRGGFSKMMELAKKHKIELFSRPGGGRQLPPPPAAGRNIGRPDFRKLRQLYPEEMKKYEELRREKPAEARKILEELVKRSNSGK